MVLAPRVSTRGAQAKAEGLGASYSPRRRQDAERPTLSGGSTYLHRFRLMQNRWPLPRSGPVRHHTTNSWLRRCPTDHVFDRGGVVEYPHESGHRRLPARLRRETCWERCRRHLRPAISFPHRSHGHILIAAGSHFCCLRHTTDVTSGAESEQRLQRDPRDPRFVDLGGRTTTGSAGALTDLASTSDTG